MVYHNSTTSSMVLHGILNLVDKEPPLFIEGRKKYLPQVDALWREGSSQDCRSSLRPPACDPVMKKRRVLPLSNPRLSSNSQNSPTSWWSLGREVFMYSAICFTSSQLIPSLPSRHPLRSSGLKKSMSVDVQLLWKS